MSAKPARKVPSRTNPDFGEGDTPADIILAARDGDVERVGAILVVDPEAIYDRDENGFTALHHACFHCDLSVLQLLLSAPGVDCYAEDNWGRWPIHYSYLCPNEILKTQIYEATFPPPIDDRDLRIVDTDPSN